MDVDVAGFSPKQVDSILDADARVNVWHGSVRSGKTLASVWAFMAAIDQAAEGGGRIVIVGRTMDTIDRNVIATMRDISPGDVIYTRGSNVARVLGHTVEIIGANNVLSESRIRGMTIKLAYVDEGSLLPDLGYWEQLLNRQLTVPDARTYVTTNPEGPQHWLKTEVIDKADDLGYRSWHFLLDDNPVLTDEAKEFAGKVNTGVYYDRNILGLWKFSDGMIWDSWNEDRHVVDDLPKCSRWHVGVDDGTAGTFAAVLVGLGEDGNLYVARELRWNAKERRSQLTDGQKSKLLGEWLSGCEAGTWESLPALDGCTHPEAIHVDPSATSLIRQLELDGWRGAVRKARNDVHDGLSYVASLFALVRLLVHSSCTGLRKEIPGYVWDPKVAEKGEDKPIKANDHNCDALRYDVMGMPEVWWDWLASPSQPEGVS